MKGLLQEEVLCRYHFHQTPPFLSPAAVDHLSFVDLVNLDQQLTLGVKPGISLSVSLHRTTPSFSEVFKNSSGSAMFFLGELSTPSDINHVTVCSSGFIAPRNDHCLGTHCYKRNKVAACSVSICNSHPHFC